MSSPKPWIEACGVDAGYRERPVLHDVSFGAARGEIVAVVGPNGAGKSTLLRVLAGTLAPTRGRVRLGDHVVSSLTRGEVARRLAVVPQDSDVAFGFTVREVVSMGRAPHQSGLLIASDADRSIVAGVLAGTDLGALAERPVAELSGGERRRVVIARALAQQPEVLLLDEPAAHLDIRHAVALYETARTEATEQHVACVAVMHDLNAAARWADRVVLLSEGRVRAQGSVDDVLEPGLLEEVFGLPVRVGIDEAEGVRYFLPRPRR